MSVESVTAMHEPPVAAIPFHHHSWTVREHLDQQLGRYESWFECEGCQAPYA